MSASTVLIVLSTACSGPAAPPQVTVTARESVATTVVQNPLTRPGSSSVWVTDVSNAPVSERSDELVEDLAKQVEDRYGGVAAFNVNQYTTSTWTAPWWVAPQDVTFDDCQSRGDVPADLYDGPAYFRDLPIPATVVPSQGADGQLTIYSPATDQLWELWKARRVDGGWSACWGGRIDHVSTSEGVFDGAGGASASGLAVSAGSLTVSEAKSAQVGHALALAIPEIAEAPVLSWPAKRTDGRSADEDAIPMGQRFRLDPRVDVGALGMHPVAESVARAVQQYGFIVTDSSGAVSVVAETGETARAGAGEDDPWRRVLDGTPSYAVLDGFPWEDLQALPTDWGSPNG